MERLSVDVAVIGAGTAGLNARCEVEKRGGRALLIESTVYGTTCARFGSRPFVPAPFDAVRADVMTSDELFELADLPASIAVIGTGVIALELGQAMNRLGVRTAFFSPFDELGPFTDPEIRRIVRRDLGGELDLRPRARAPRAGVVPAGGSRRGAGRLIEVVEVAAGVLFVLGAKASAVRNFDFSQHQTLVPCGHE